MSDVAPDLGRTASPTRRQHAQALLLAMACAVLFLRESLLPGTALVPHPPELFDVVMEEAIAAGTFDREDAFRGNVGMTDKYLQSLCWDRVMQDRFEDGEFPRWTRDIGGGAPFVPQMAQPFQPINLLLLLLPSVEWYGWWYFVHLTLFGWFAYRFLRRVGSAHGGALLALVAATLGMWTQCKLHHNVILTAALSLWPMLSAVHELVARGARSRGRRFAVGWLALWSGLSWSTGFVVIALQATYLTGAFALLCLWQAPAGDRLRRLFPVAAGFLLGGAMSLANMLPILLASAESARQGQFDAARLADLAAEGNQLLSAIWPSLLSWPADHFYPSIGGGTGFFTRVPLSQTVLLDDPFRADGTPFQNWVESSYAVGVIPLAAAASALCARRHRVQAWFFGLFAVCAFGMATATEPFFAVAQLLPGVTVGDVRRLLFLVAMPLVVLSGLGADAWLRDGFRAPGRAALAAVAVASIGGLAWLWTHSGDASFARGRAELFVRDADHPLVRQVGGDAAIAAKQFQAIAAPGELDVNYAALSGSFWTALLAAAGGLLALWRGGRWTLTALLSVTAAELVITGLGPVQTVDVERVTRVPALLRPVAEQHALDQPRPRIQRLVPPGSLANTALPGNVPGFLGFADAFAYNPLPKARFEAFFNSIEPGVSHSGAGVGAFEDPRSLSHPLCDLYGVRFILTRLEPPADAQLLDRTPAGTGGYRLFERPTAMPRATFVRGVDVLERRSDRLEALGARERDVRGRVVLEDSRAPTPEPAEGAEATVAVTLHDDERVEVRVTCSHDGYVRLADPYDAGWRATVDGEEAPIYIADHYLRAVYVGAGEHDVVFTYDQPRAVWPLRLSLFALLGVLAALVSGRRAR
ncbi:MAG: YfhO family protein [Planctomycetota bacterium]|nr:YfhO family protein [Planctomycetota bacterium]